jgi:hypothetical protein
MTAMTGKRRIAVLGCGLTALAAALIAGQQIAVAAPPSTPAAPAFSPRQVEQFSVPGSLSNAWADFDQDGDLDLAVSLKTGEIRLYRNDDGVFTDIGAAVGLPRAAKNQEARGLSWGDYDDDGWPDLFVGSSIPTAPSALFHNLGGKSFVDVAPQVGLTMPGRSSRQNNWIDYDNDGDLDLYATDRIGANRLYRNDGGTFVDAFPGQGPTDARSTVGACWLDYDNDGDLDLFLGNQSGKTDALWRNDGGKGFVDVAPALGMAMVGRTSEEGGVGCAVGDYDNDGFLDIFVPNYGHNVLWHNNGNGTFTNVADKLGVGVENHAVGASWGDYDNDGYIDLAVMSYEGPPGKQVPHDALFHNLGGKHFVNVLTVDSALNSGDHGVEWVDYDRDGALDLSTTRGYSPVGGHYLFHNDLPKAAAQRSLNVLVLGANGHFNQPGAEVRLYDRAGKILGAGQVSTGGGYGVQDAQPVHFGLRKLAPVTVEVSFMSATGRKVQRVTNVDPRAYWGRSLVVKRQ